MQKIISPFLENSHINAFLTIEYLWLFIFHTIYYFNICSKNTQLLV